jgi:hypothetical protein
MQHLVRMKLRPIDPTDLIAASGGEVSASPSRTPIERRNCGVHRSEVIAKTMLAVIINWLSQPIGWLQGMERNCTSCPL